jgi:hypothetical protein
MNRKTLTILAITYNVLNICDIILTLYMRYKFDGQELNPFMASLIRLHPAYFILVKVIIGVLITTLMLKYSVRLLIYANIIISILIGYQFYTLIQVL